MEKSYFITWFNSSVRFSTGSVQSFCTSWLAGCTPCRDVIPFSSRLTKRSTVRAAISTEKDELVWPLDSALFAFGGEGPDDTLKVCCFGNDDHLCIRHGGVIHEADTVGEALTGWFWRFFGAWRSTVALGFSCWWIILLERQLSSSEDQGSSWAHGHQISGNPPCGSRLFCAKTTQRELQWTVEPAKHCIPTHYAN